MKIIKVRNYNTAAPTDLFDSVRIKIRGNQTNLCVEAKQCAQLIKEARSIAVLTGAGISTAAGIPDFRGPQGLYVTRRYDPEKVFDIDYFLRDPKPFFDFARDFIGLEEKIKPTTAHRFLANLETQGKMKGVITQNIDDLHQSAGSKNVLELHGSFLKSFCWDCGQEFSFEQLRSKILSEDVPKCSCQGVIKPDIVFFGENVKCLDEAYQLAQEVDLFLVIGTSCVVYPAASIPDAVSGKIVVVNGSPVHLNSSRARLPSGEERGGQVILSVQEDIDSFLGKVENCLKSPLP